MITLDVKLLAVLTLFASVNTAMAQQSESLDARQPAVRLRTPRPDEASFPHHEAFAGSPASAMPVMPAATPQGADYYDTWASDSNKHPALQRLKRRLQYTHWGYADQFYPRPFGTYAISAFAAQIANGTAAQLTLYRYDFADPTGGHSAELNTHGRIRLVRMASVLMGCPYPLNIEYDPDHPPLNEARRQVVLEQLRQINGFATEEQVVVRIPHVRGRDAAEGLIIYQNLLQHTQQGPTPFISDGIQGGSTGTGSASGAVIAP